MSNESEAEDTLQNLNVDYRDIMNSGTWKMLLEGVSYQAGPDQDLNSMGRLFVFSGCI